VAERDSLWTMNGATRVLNAEDARVGTTALLVPGTSVLRARQGLRPSTGSPGLVTASGTPDVNIKVEKFAAVLTATRGFGEYVATLDADKTMNILGTTPAHGSQQRNHIIIGRQSDTYYSDGSTKFEVVEVIGTPGAGDPTALLAAIPDYIPLARLRITANATTVTTAMIDDLRPSWFVALGGLLPIKDTADRATLTPYPGMPIWRIDKKWIEVHDGTAWRVQGLVVTAALADITHPVAGQLALLSTDNMVYRYTGSGWLDSYAAGGITSATRHRARYFQSGTAQAPASGVQQRIDFNSSSFTSADWTTSTVSGGTVFTCARAGAYEWVANARFVGGVAAERALTIASSGLGTVYGTSSAYTGGTAPWSASVTVEQDFSVGDTVSIYAYQSATATLAFDLPSSPTSVTIRHVGPKAT